MNNFTNILPEACYKRQNLTMDEVVKAYLSNSTIVGYVENVDAQNKQLIVSLGENLKAFLSYSDATIYPLTYAKSVVYSLVPVQISSLLRKTICVKVKSIEDDKIILSRYQNMLEAYENIACESIVIFNVTNTYGKNLFGDIGWGIQAIIVAPNIMKARVHAAKNWFNPGDMIPVKVLSFNEIRQACVSHRAAFPEYNTNDYKIGDKLVAVVTDPVDEFGTGYFVSITPQVIGILDADDSAPIFNYGDKIEVVVQRVTYKGLHLRFSRKLP